MADTITPTPEQAVSPAEVAELRAKLARAERRSSEHEARAAGLEQEKEVWAKQEAARTIDAAIRAEATAVGWTRDLDHAPKLIDRHGIRIDENGRVIGVKRALEDFIADHADFAALHIDGVPPAPRGGTPPPARRPPVPRSGGEKLNHLGFPVGSVEAAMTERVVPFFM